MDRSVAAFFIVLLGAGWVMHFVGFAYRGSDMAGQMPISFLHVCVTAGVLGILSAFIMTGEWMTTWKTAAMHIGGVPLFFILGFDDVQLLVVAIYACYALAYLLTIGIHYGLAILFGAVSRTSVIKL